MAKEKKKTIASATEGSSSSKIARAISTRGRTFQGVVIRKFAKRVAIEFERTVYIQKFERYLKKKTRIHARLPDSLAHEINLGDLIKVQECRPLSKLIHFVVVEKIRSKENN